MEPEIKKHQVKFEEGKIIYQADLNQDGEPSIEVKISLKEIPEEAVVAWQDLKGK